MQVDTGIGTVHAEVVGGGPAALLWHSLFLDSHQWDRVRDTLAAHRTLVLVDGPGHGRGGLPPRRFTFDDCADAAALVLGTLGLGPDVDWVGNAWGGHVGYAYASRYPARSLVTIGAPPTPLPPAERRRIALLTAAYRAVGPRPLTGAVVAALLGPDADADSVAMVRDTFRANDRTGMQRVMRAMMLQRPDLTERLQRISAPVLLIAGDRDPMWTPARAAATAAGLPHVRTAEIENAGHLPPLETPAPTAAEILSFWRQTSPVTS
ncbi:alpha/beta fold hydrolase [Pseudonocardia sp. CA-142604]|uniref:alpha/beta fold hydrolase n=1 Tax=Pseudonocardia sp. CA-142604 TaxID=3240024 RepID=UPI003D923A31